MRVVAEQERLAPPSLCFICETSPIREGERPNVVDTQRDYNPPALSHLSGRKYICERCVDEAAHLLGYIRTDELETAQAALDQARASLQQMSNTARSLSDEATALIGNAVGLFPNSPVVSIPKDKNTQGAKDGA